MAAHEVNRAYCRAIDDNSQVEWDQAADLQKTSALEGVDAVFAGKTSEQLHESWCNAKRRDGWVYGVTKDATAKTHPALVPYSALPDWQKKKDDLFGATVRAMAAALGYPVDDTVTTKDSLKVQTSLA
jgi:hypothetical protein